MLHLVHGACDPTTSSMHPIGDLRGAWTAATLAVAGLLLAGCGDDRCTDESACPAGPSETPSQELWRINGNFSLTLVTPKQRIDVPIRPRDLHFFVAGSAETCDTATSEACSEIDVELLMLLPTIDHDHPETGELVFVTKDPEITVFGTMSLDPAYTDESVYRAATLEARTCSELQSSPPDGPFRGQGHQVHWTSEIEFRVSREGEGATLSFTGMPLTLTDVVESCEPFEFSLTGNLALGR